MRAGSSASITGFNASSMSASLPSFRVNADSWDSIGLVSDSEITVSASWAPSIRVAACDRRLCSLLISVHSPDFGASFSNSLTCHSSRSRSSKTFLALVSNSSRCLTSARHALYAVATAFASSSKPA